VSDCITIELPLPPKQMRPNARCHWRAKLKPKAQQRQEAYLCAKAACANPPRWELAEVEATFYVARRWDSDNCIGSMKASADGLEDAGIVVNDSGFIWLPPKQVIDGKRTGKRGVVLRITKRDQ
jgi:hypothetical protein